MQSDRRQDIIGTRLTGRYYGTKALRFGPIILRTHNGYGTKGGAFLSDMAHNRLPCVQITEYLSDRCDNIEEEAVFGRTGGKLSDVRRFLSDRDVYGAMCR